MKDVSIGRYCLSLPIRACQSVFSFPFRKESPRIVFMMGMMQLLQYLPSSFPNQLDFYFWNIQRIGTEVSHVILFYISKFFYSNTMLRWRWWKEKEVWSNNNQHFVHHLYCQRSLAYLLLSYRFLMIQSRWLKSKGKICPGICLTFLRYVFPILDTDSLQKDSGENSFAYRCIELTSTSSSLFQILSIMHRNMMIRQRKSSTFSSACTHLSFGDVSL